MKIWLVTTGSSDVQLINNTLWNDWHREVKHNYKNLYFEPRQLVEAANHPFRIASRVLGMIYEAQPEEVWRYLTFPLHKVFTDKLNLEDVDKIILLLSDQTHAFDENDKNELRCPYWQDTCTLKPVFERYFKEHFPDTELITQTLMPQSAEQGLDDWNQALKIVSMTLDEITLTPDTVYVSHQAGTPAISSAVQFMSLARFRNKVVFLVSNEYRAEQAHFIQSSSYLRSIQIQEARALLHNFDYLGVKNLVYSYLNLDQKNLIDSAIKWNQAKFYEFSDLLDDISQERVNEWWWITYEAAYLAVVRHAQGNIVDAFFHSFRAVESAFSEWGKNKLKSHVIVRGERPFLQKTILSDSKDYFEKAKFKTDRTPKDDLAKLKIRLEDLKNGQDLILFSGNLYPLFRTCRKEYRHECPDLKEFWDSNNGIAGNRNIIFHQLKGLTEDELFAVWNVENIDKWKLKLLKYLNFIVNQPAFTSLQEASLMAQVHRELESAIAGLM